MRLPISSNVHRAAHLAEPRVIQHDEQHIRRAFTGPHRGRPRWRGLLGRPPDHAGERSTLLIFDNWHSDPLPLLALYP